MAYTTIDDGSEYFHTQLYTGDAQSSKVITNDANAGDFKPDWLWIKERSSTSSHLLFDSTRGTNKKLTSNSTDSEETFAYLSSYDTDGFTIGTSDGAINDTQTYVAWQWKANGGTTSSNTDGSITTTVQANTTAGFSIVTYAGSNSASTVGHGLGAVPEVIFVKNRDASANWKSYHKPILETHTLSLNGTGAKADQESFNDTAPTSTVFSLLGNTDNVNRSGEDFVAYCFAPIQGYSKFGSYTGNGATPGPFVYTGFKPAWVMIKRSSGTSQWEIHDNKRPEYNPTDFLLAESTSAENTGADAIDFLSNGFKCNTGSRDNTNYNGSTHIYMAFAEHPFVSSKGVPVTAR